MSTSTLTPRQTFRDVLAQAAEQARALLPVSTNGRIESAVKLVLSGDLFFNEDGSVEVGGSDPSRYYRLVGSTCTCTDFVQEKAPQGMCKHRIAANLHKSVERVLARRAAPEPEPEIELPVDFEMYPDNDPEETPMPCPAPAPVPLPEAPASVNCHITIAGRQVQLTLRGVSEDEVLTRLERVLARYPVSPPTTSAVPEPEKRFCPTHGTEMQRNEKEGRFWWSHRTADGQWCKGK
jgi:hypothetical protein